MENDQALGGHVCLLFDGSNFFEYFLFGLPVEAYE